jgi:5-formyltetrahydrofolate cyclo-ligase
MMADSAVTVGLALKEQMLSNGAAVPCDSEDWTMDQVITGAGD